MPPPDLFNIFPRAICTDTTHMITVEGEFFIQKTINMSNTSLPWDKPFVGFNVMGNTTSYAVLNEVSCRDLRVCREHMSHSRCRPCFAPWSIAHTSRGNQNHGMSRTNNEPEYLV